MYIPAVSTILCMVWFSPAILTREAKIFLASFLAATIVSLGEGLYQPLLGTIGPLPLLTVVVSAGSLLLAVILNLQKPGREALGPALLAVGRNLRYYLLLPVAFSALFIAGLLFSHYAGLALPAIAFDPWTFGAFLGLYLVTSVVSWPKFFGEEYGWRYYLQDRMFGLYGTGKGVVLIGLIWGLWHLPLNLVGLNFAENLVAGNLVYLVYTITIGIIFSFAVLKTGSIWIAVLLHAITDALVVTGYPYIANGQVLFAFIPVLVLLGVLAIVLLRSAVWVEADKPAP
ncbi:MAG: CPBP family intramembrane metalloprotease [Methanomicrobiales archaeon]|nr:CPBP family intramembrane metalloprotease [Methanomicrobiales archaeon]